ncbi:hypothetical protein [Streptomyces sp. NRRL F-5193]|uniref:hypothetical protein n=1 Tax=Streptomyces sp. NRRL F-5193 TaxID=1463860 RepID=UPI0005BA2E92|nr:hypothetical protein [Streptomyces sp. NRRL F-5193]
MNAPQPLGKPSRKLALDASSHEFALLAQKEWPTVDPYWRQRALTQAMARLPLPAKTMTPQEAGTYFTAMREALEEDLRRLAQSYPSVQWLWYLRRLPDLFDDALSTTGPYDRALMELMAATSTKSCAALPRTQGKIGFPVTIGTVRRVLRLASTCIVLSGIHSRLRRAGKGMAFEPSEQDLPSFVPAPEIQQAITLYDERVAASGSGLLGAGTKVLSDEHQYDDPAMVIVATSLPAWRELPSVKGTPADGQALTVWGRYVPRDFSLRTLRDLLQLTRPYPEDWWQPQLPALIALLQSIAVYLGAYTTYGWISLTRYGYLSLRRDILTELLTRALPELREELDEWFPSQQLNDAQHVLELLDTLPSTLWPVTPPAVLHHAGDDVLVDLEAAGRHLLRLCTIAPPQQGPVVNIRAEHFEESVQDLIDRSPWKPSDRAPARQFKPRLPGQGEFTDLDAVGEQGDTLLIVSCKSRPYTGEYDAGDYRTVRNTVTLVEQAVAKWQQVVKTFTANPQGANYDLRRYRRILGLVCLPHVPYTLEGPATAIIDTSPEGVELRMVSSYGELSEWLNPKKQQP